MSIFFKKPAAPASDTGFQNKKIPFAIIESYKSIRTNLSFLLASSKNNVVLVTSPNSGEGKSTTAVNMAISFSQLGEKVLLVDADMRRSSLHKKLKVENEEGLSSILAGMSDVKDCIKRINENLYFLPAGRIPPNPSELLGSANYEKLIDSIAPDYGCVIVDTPPMLVVSDTLIAAPCTAGIVLVVRDGQTQNNDVKRVVETAKFAGIKILGTVINGNKQSHGRNYKYNARYYKGH